MIDRTRASKPYLDIVLTHIDDRFEPGMRDALGADVARSLPAIQARKSTLLVEDPATLVEPGSRALCEARWKNTARSLPTCASLAVDINVVERYQDVYPTKKQTGVELLELIHQAATSFRECRALFRKFTGTPGSALDSCRRYHRQTHKRSSGAFRMSKRPKTPEFLGRAPSRSTANPGPIANDKSVLAPAGKHTLEASSARPAVSISDFNGEIRTADPANDRADSLTQVAAAP